MLDGLRREVSVTELCRREGIASNLLSFLKTLSVARCEPRGLARSADFAGPLSVGTPATPVRYQDVHYVYVLRSVKDGNLYTGYTTELRRRVSDHAAGQVSSTRDRRPLHLIYYEAYLLPKDTKAREVFLKSGFGKRYIRNPMSHYFSASKT